MSLDRGFEKGSKFPGGLNILGYESEISQCPIIYGELQSPSTSSLFRYDALCVYAYAYTSMRKFWDPFNRIFHG